MSEQYFIFNIEKSLITKISYEVYCRIIINLDRQGRDYMLNNIIDYNVSMIVLEK